MALTEAQEKNVAWYLPRPRKKGERYKGGMPLYAEEWIFDLAKQILGTKDLKVFNVFCGKSKFGFRIDINPEVKPDLLYDIHKLSECQSLPFVPNVIFADSPYSNKEAREIYGTKPLNYSKWTGECAKLLADGGLFIIYHKLLPRNPDPENFEVVKRVFIAHRVWHTTRIAIFFQKKGYLWHSNSLKEAF